VISLYLDARPDEHGQDRIRTFVRKELPAPGRRARRRRIPALSHFGEGCMSSKNNINPDHYKLGGRGRPGETLAPRSPIARSNHEPNVIPGERRMPGDVVRTRPIQARPIQLVRSTKRRRRPAGSTARAAGGTARRSGGSRPVQTRKATRARTPAARASSKSRASWRE
jgi:hypothetical protein